MQTIETELEWLFFQLWTKKAARATVFAFHIPDTVIVRPDQTPVWYFTNKEGYFLRKNLQNVRPAKMLTSFLKQNLKTAEQAAATAYFMRLHKRAPTSLSNNSEQVAKELLCDFIRVKDLSAYLTHTCSSSLLNKSPPLPSLPNVIQ